MKKFLFSLPLDNGTVLKFHAGDVVLMPNGTKVVLTDNSKTSLLKVLVLNALAFNQHFSGVRTIDEIVQHFDGLKTIEEFESATPALVKCRTRYFGGIYQRMPEMLCFKITSTDGSEPVLTLDEVVVPFGEVEYMLTYLNGEMKFGAQVVGGNTIQIGACVGGAVALVDILDEYLAELKSWNDLRVKSTFEASLAEQKLLDEAKAELDARREQERRSDQLQNRTPGSIARDFGISRDQVVRYLNGKYAQSQYANSFKPSTVLTNVINREVRQHYARFDRR